VIISINENAERRTQNEAIGMVVDVRTFRGRDYGSTYLMPSGSTLRQYVCAGQILFDRDSIARLLHLLSSMRPTC